MSDFDKAVVAAMLKAKEIGVKMLASDCEAILQAAIASMQGEVVAWVTFSTKEWFGKANGVGVISYVERDEFKYPLFTYPPSASAEIARLQKELEEARKVPDGYAVVPIEPTVEIAEAFQKAMLKEFGMQTTLGYHKRIYKSMLDAAILQIGGAE